MKEFYIGGREIAVGKGPFIIAEIAQAHDGSLGMAHAFIDAVAKTGADAIKFQTHIASEESSKDEPWRVKFSFQDASRYDYWKRMEFTLDQWLGLKKHAEEKQLVFLSSPFSPLSVDWLQKCGVPAWKIASGEINNFLLYDAIAETRKPVIISSGMSAIDELSLSVDYFKKRNIPFMLVQCTTQYPSQPENVGLGYMSDLRERFGCHVGFSDHSGKIYAGLAAAALGAELIEVHVTMSKDSFGPDVSSSITIDELRMLVEGTRDINKMVATKTYSKELFSKVSEDNRRIFGKGLAARRVIKAGEIIDASMIYARKPMIGIPVTEVNCVLGKRAISDIWNDESIRTDMIGDK